jgi:hypothetical protein
MDLTNLEIQILRILEDHQGKLNRIGRFVMLETINAACPLFPVLEREMRRTIKHLREQHGERIGSDGRGYYKAMTADEVKAISRYHRKRALSELVSAAKIEKSSLAELLGQLSIEFGIPNADCGINTIGHQE